MPSKKLFLLDGMALIFRAHFALIKNPRVNSKGVNTSAPMGFTNSLLEILKKEKPTHIAVAFDTSAPTFRHEEYTEYKANRQETPEDISVAIPIVKEIVKAFNIPILEMNGYEADDIIGTLAKQAARKDFEVFMMTPDKDYAQLVEDHIFLYKPATRGNDIDILGIPEVLAKFDLDNVDQVIDLLGLMGDAVDNIPGIPGVGPKTAVKLLKEYGTVENLLDNADKLKGKQKEKVMENKEQALMSKRLATIKIDVPIAFDETALHYDTYNEAELRKIFDELEFRTLSKRIFGDDGSQTAAKQGPTTTGQMSLFGNTPTTQATTATTVEVEPEEEIPTEIGTIHDTLHDYQLIDTPELRKELIHFLSLQDEFCFDTETSSLSAIESELVGMSFAYRPHEAYYVPIPEDQEAAKAIVSEFKEVFENEKVGKIAQNLKYDMMVMRNYGIEINGPLFDTMLAHYLLHPEQRHGMDHLSTVYLNYEPVSIETLIGKKGKNQLSMREVPVENAAEYAAEDADITLQLKQVFAPMLDKEPKLKKLLEEIEIPLVKVLAEVEMNGVKIDTENLANSSKELEVTIAALEKSIYEAAGEEFNVGSPKQLGEILFGKLKLVEKPKKTKSGQYATGEEILINLANDHQIVSDILEFRQLQKLKSTYVDALPKMISKKDGLIHTSYNQAVTATGRLSSTDPNLQNIPIRTEKGREIRKAFVPRNKDFTILAADYSQVELRIMAAFSEDAHMVDAFKQGKDIHTATAAKVFKVTESEVDSDMRRKAKTANFGIIYGVSAFGLSQQLNIPRKEAGELIDKYFEEFPSVKAYMDNAINKARDDEFAETIMGRRRYLRDINSRNFTVRGMAERNAINAPIQGSAADIIKKAMIDIQQWIEENNLKSKMIMQVHDELVFDAHNDELELLQQKVKELMENAYQMAVPLEVEVGIGQNWLEAH
ncbi:DNA polymerase I [Limibacter armeniacum]|uniref:DNA polymerase I n=1 Tax=Limibacter armeniacum TaxID=466084 RepID=UPI002FE58E62